MSVAVVIPFRDRGLDPLRLKNLECVQRHWDGYGAEWLIVGDGRDGDEPFNRSAALNRGAMHTTADVLIFAEADMLVDYGQIDRAVELAGESPGLVMPFTVYHALTPEQSERARAGEHPSSLTTGPGSTRTSMVHGGALNVMSRDTLERVGGFDERFHGNGYDDDAMKMAFEVCCGATRWVGGPGYHLYHVPGFTGDHLSDADVRATARNRQRLSWYRRARTPEQIHALTCQ